MVLLVSVGTTVGSTAVFTSVTTAVGSGATLVATGTVVGCTAGTLTPDAVHVAKLSRAVVMSVVAPTVLPACNRAKALSRIAVALLAAVSQASCACVGIDNILSINIMNSTRRFAMKVSFDMVVNEFGFIDSSITAIAE